MLIYIELLVLGLCAGVLSGFAGIGGAIIIVPALVVIFGYDQLRAQGTSLAALIPPVGLLGFMQYYKNPNVQIDLWAAGMIAAGLLVGGLFGGKLANHLDPVVVRKAFSVIMACTAVYLFLKK